LTDVNHLDLVGWINTARYKWAEMTGREIKFKPATFYLGIVDMLAKEVEGYTDEKEKSSKGEDEVRDQLREHIQENGEERKQRGEPSSRKVS